MILDRRGPVVPMLRCIAWGAIMLLALNRHREHNEAAFLATGGRMNAGGKIIAGQYLILSRVHALKRQHRCTAIGDGLAAFLVHF